MPSLQDLAGCAVEFYKAIWPGADPARIAEKVEWEMEIAEARGDFQDFGLSMVTPEEKLFLSNVAPPGEE